MSKIQSVGSGGGVIGFVAESASCATKCEVAA